MKKFTILLTALLFTLTLSAQNPTAREIIEQSQQVTKISGLETKTRLEIHDARGNVRVRETTMASRLYPDGTEKRVIIFLAPADVRGTGMLIFDYPEKDDDMWIYMPSLHKTRKIVTTEKSKSFMGSEFSNADLTIGNLDDFTYTLSGEEEIRGEKCWKIRVLPVNQKIASEYNLTEKTLWISQKDKVPRQALFTDLNKKPWKEMSYEGIRELDPAQKKFFVTSMQINNLQNNRYSRMEMSEVTLNANVKEHYFTTLFLEQQ